MPRRPMPPRGGELWHLLHTRPRDPAWAPASQLENTRRRLRDYDTYFDLWWVPHARANMEHAGRWGLYAFLPIEGVWKLRFLWEGPNGEYRGPDCPEAILARSALGDSRVNGKSLVDKAKEIDEHNARVDAQRNREQREGAWSNSMSFADYASSAKPSGKSGRVFQVKHPEKP